MFFSSPLLTDFYQLTMASSYLSSGMAERDAVFQLFFRKAPFKGSYAIACGLEDAIYYIENFHFKSDDLDYLRTLNDKNGQQQFSDTFLDYLASLKLSINLDAVPEGTVIFAQEPILRIHGPLLQCQLLESALLNIINFQTLIATKASRIRIAAQDDDVIEFGLRRAQGFDGALSASRAAFIGGCNSTSNVLAGKHFKIPVRGTLAHSYVMSCDSELEAFRSYTQSFPNNSILLVDTYNTLNGVKHAISVGKELEQRGQTLTGIRLDSGDLLMLSKTARKMLDEHGFNNTKIIASGDLDEYTIADLKSKGANIDSWGVGTRLVVAYDEPALGGVYKLCGLKSDEGIFSARMKLTDNPQKATLPGELQVKRVMLNNKFSYDIIYNEILGISPNLNVYGQNLLQPAMRRGATLNAFPNIFSIQKYAMHSLYSLPENMLQIRNASMPKIIIDPAVQSQSVEIRENYARPHNS